MLTLGVAWFIIPMDWSFEYYGIIFNSWRLLIAIVAAPSLLSAILLSFFPESPRWLLSKGRCDQARDVLANVYSTNLKKPRDEYPVSCSLIFYSILIIFYLPINSYCPFLKLLLDF